MEKFDKNRELIFLNKLLEDYKDILPYSQIKKKS